MNLYIGNVSIYQSNTWWRNNSLKGWDMTRSNSRLWMFSRLGHIIAFHQHVWFQCCFQFSMFSHFTSYRIENGFGQICNGAQSIKTVSPCSSTDSLSRVYRSWAWRGQDMYNRCETIIGTSKGIKATSRGKWFDCLDKISISGDELWRYKGDMLRFVRNCLG